MRAKKCIECMHSVYRTQFLIDDYKISTIQFLTSNTEQQNLFFGLSRKQRKLLLFHSNFVFITCTTRAKNIVLLKAKI